MSKLFESKDGGVPFPRSAAEWQAKVNPLTGAHFTPKEAEHKMAKEVFGHDHRTDASGNPIEQGKGSALQPTQQHLQALDISREAERARAMRLGWHPGMDQAFDPKIAALIEENARLKAQIAKPRKKPGPKAKRATAAAQESTAA